MPREPKFTPADIEYWKGKINPDTGKKYTQSDIARIYGVTRAYVSWVKHQTQSFSRTPREAVMDHFPWRTTAEFHESSPYKRARDHLEYMATGGKGMSHDKLRRLRWFYDYLERDNVVLEFDPDIPPSEGIQTGGFAYQPRRKDDGDLIIRVNEHTTLTEEGRMLWRFPPKKPTIR